MRSSLLAGLITIGCATGASGQVGEPAHAAPRGTPIQFAFPPVEGEAVTHETTRGRATALLFITTYDMVSQVNVQRLGEVIVDFTPRANAAAIVLEAPRYADLAVAYRQSLSLPFPVVMADFETHEGRGPFGDIRNVPTLVILDGEGRETFRRQGPLTAPEIEAELKRASRGVSEKRFAP